jgi:hypothetical protein
MNCCIPNKSGIIAKKTSSLRFRNFIVATPISVRTAPAEKLAAAQKHIEIILGDCQKAGEDPERNFQAGSKDAVSHDVPHLQAF